MIRPRTIPAATVLPTIVVECPEAIPELDIRADDWIIVNNLGEPGGAILYRHLDGPTAQRLLTHVSSAVYALPASRPPRRRLRLLKPRP